MDESKLDLPTPTYINSCNVLHVPYFKTIKQQIKILLYLCSGISPIWQKTIRRPGVRLMLAIYFSKWKKANLPPTGRITDEITGDHDHTSYFDTVALILVAI
jgi:hypothetical protein